MAMTDEQTIKALECCMKQNNCGGCCPYDDEDDTCEGCTSKLAGDALDLIKRQQAEAYKEFADKLTDRIADAMDRSHDNPNGSNYDLTDVFDTIHNLVKELTEGGK